MATDDECTASETCHQGGEEPGAQATAAPGQTATDWSRMLKIGVMGGATGEFTRDVLARAHALGRAIAKADCILITGACPGLPLASACGAKDAGGMVVGISPGLSLDEHVYKYGSPTPFCGVARPLPSARLRRRGPTPMCGTPSTSRSSSSWLVSCCSGRRS